MGKTLLSYSGKIKHRVLKRIKWKNVHEMLIAWPWVDLQIEICLKQIKKWHFNISYHLGAKILGNTILEHTRLLNYLFMLSHIYFSFCLVYYLPSPLTCDLYHWENKSFQVSCFLFSLKIHAQIFVLTLIHFSRLPPITRIDVYSLNSCPCC